MPGYDTGKWSDPNALEQVRQQYDLPASASAVRPQIPAQQQANSQLPQMRRPQDIHEDVYYRARGMEMQAGADYQNRMALAKTDEKNYDPALAQTAAAIYQADISRIEGYKAELQAKWKTVDNADQFNSDQKLALKYKILNSTNDPIFIPKQTAKERQGNPIEQALQMENHIANSRMSPRQQQVARQAAGLPAVQDIGDKIDTLNAELNTKYAQGKKGWGRVNPQSGKLENMTESNKIEFQSLQNKLTRLKEQEVQTSSVKNVAKYKTGDTRIVNGKKFTYDGKMWSE